MEPVDYRKAYKKYKRKYREARFQQATQRVPRQSGGGNYDQYCTNCGSCSLTQVGGGRGQVKCICNNCQNCVHF